ncbi:MAG: DUF1722 domain-containing protein [Gammaproteobacteria bacterium]|nr:DUF1722 domain-containing protein [Gammaproteobacteria bacterium]
MNAETAPAPAIPRVILGISSCLLGQAVRFDGNHKYNGYIAETLGQVFEFRPFCPEMAIGLGVPRPPIRLVTGPDGLRARGVDDPARDVTAPLAEYALQVAGQLEGVSGYLFKKGSPSCGMERVSCFDEEGLPISGDGAGIFARTLMARCPELPVEEEGRLMDPVLRENFIERVFIYQRWQALCRDGLTAAGLVDFHTRHKFNLLAHDEPAYRALGRRVAEAGKGDIATPGRDYIRAVMTALKKPATPGTHTNVLQHIYGFLKDRLDGEGRGELLDCFEQYRLGQIPLIVPVTLLRHHLRRHPDGYIERQYYLNPHPHELMLRNLIWPSAWINAGA